MWYVAGVPIRIKKLIFHCKVVSAAMAGMDTYPLTSAECLRLDRHIVRLLRRVMQGRSSQAPAAPGGRWRRMSGRAVLRHMGVLPTELELAARRLSWLQAMVRAPGEHQHVMAALWGEMRDDGPALDTAGRLTDRAPRLAWRLEPTSSSPSRRAPARSSWLLGAPPLWGGATSFATPN